jgi:hypothetical protein
VTCCVWRPRPRCFIIPRCLRRGRRQILRRRLCWTDGRRLCRRLSRRNTWQLTWRSRWIRGWRCAWVLCRRRSRMFGRRGRWT